MSTSIEAINALGAPSTSAIARDAAAVPLTSAQQATGSFSGILLSGLGKVDHQIAEADSLVRRFALGEPIPVHQVTIALEQARISLELAMQVRSRLLEGYREIMNMQL